jgi:phospholipid-binding lipoprotein MlaA
MLTLPLSRLALPMGIRHLGLMVVCLMLTVLTGCASGPRSDPRDPWEPFNRSMWKFNESVDKAVLRPVAETYKEVTPNVVRKGVNNFFSNLTDLWSFVNNSLQLKPREAMESLTRFNLNTFFGLGGLLDIASEAGIERHREDFGQTLGRWGVPSGPYLVVPLLGPSTLRDTAARAINATGDPVLYVNNIVERNSLYVLRIVDLRASLLRAGNVLEEAALDRYTFTRDVFLQIRRREVLGDKADDVLEDTPAPANDVK